MKNEKKNRYAALFVLYNPSENQVHKILDYIPLYNVIYVYDNSENGKQYCQLLEASSIKYIAFGTNDGLSKAYNFILERAEADKIDWLSIYDQDSKVSNQMIDTLQNFAENHDTSKIASLVPKIQYNDITVNSEKSREVKWAINSGQMLNVRLLKENEIKYDENLFLDRVDRDFCKQIELADLKILQVEGAILRQQLGESYNGHNTHSPIRNYYMFKNRFYYNKKYYHKIKAISLDIIQSGRHIINIIIVRKDVQDNLKMVLKAIKDFKDSKYGKFR